MSKRDKRTPRTSAKTKSAPQSEHQGKQSDAVSANGAKVRKMKAFYDGERRRTFLQCSESWSSIEVIRSEEEQSTDG